jgi:hypothetical protein
MAELKTVAQAGGALHAEQLAGRTQQVFFSAEEEENYLYPQAFSVDFNKRTELDAAVLDTSAINRKIREMMQQGYGTIVIQNPGAKHSLGVGILNRLQLYFEGSLGYFGCGLIDGPNVRVKGRVGWSCAENMMASVMPGRISAIQCTTGSFMSAAMSIPSASMRWTARCRLSTLIGFPANCACTASKRRAA